MSEDAKIDVWMPLYISNWNDKTQHLTCEQDGAYGRLIRFYWKNGGLPDDDAHLAQIVGLSKAKWRNLRPTIAAFFTIADGRWNHKKADALLIDQAEKRKRYIERASAGGKAKAAKSTASSTASSRPKALLGGCTLALDTEVDGPTGQSTLCGQPDFIGPKEVRDAFVGALGDEWCASYLLPCAWQDVPERALIPHTRQAAAKIIRDGRSVLAKLGLTVLEKAA